MAARRPECSSGLVFERGDRLDFLRPRSTPSKQNQLKITAHVLGPRRRARRCLALRCAGAAPEGRPHKRRVAAVTTLLFIRMAPEDVGRVPSDPAKEARICVTMFWLS
jgi:hypothetical protein